MGKLGLLHNLKNIIGGVAWRIFLWSLSLTKDEYFKQIYDQETYANNRNTI